VLIDTVTIQWNNGQGLSFSNPFTNFTVQNTVSNHNGDSGFQEFQTLNGLWTNDTANFNNWRGAQGGYYACNVGGSHPFQAHSDTINGITFAYNQTYGVHWDTDNENDTATNLTSTNNLVGSVFSEKNEGPLSITSSNLCNGNVLLGAGGLAIRNSTNVSITNSTIINNPPSQIEHQSHYQQPHQHRQRHRGCGLDAGAFSGRHSERFRLDHVHEELRFQ